VCNYCATREARKFTRDLKIVWKCSRQVSTLDAVRGIWRRGGILSEHPKKFSVLMVKRKWNQ
jgi:hypothetical protein